MNINSRFCLWLILVFFTGVTFYSQLNSGFKVDTNILKLLPETEVDPFAEEAFQRFSNNNFKQIIITISSDEKEQSLEGARWLSNKLKELELVKSFNSKLSTEEQEKVGQLYYNHRFYLLSESDQLLLNSEGIQPFIDYSLQMVYSPFSGKIISLIPQDPLLLSYRYLQNISNQTSNKNKGQFTDGFLSFSDNNQHTILLNATLNNSPFDSYSQASLIDVIEQLKTAYPSLMIKKTGAVFYAQHAASSAKKEISTIGLGSLIAVVILIVIAFRSSLPLLLTLISLGTGIFFAFTLVHFVFSSIHVLTLVFGSSLVGVAVDYAFHYFASANQFKNPLKHILTAITLGLISSVIGYFALLLTPFPGLQQMALFCASGLVGAFITVTLLFDRIPYKVNTPKWLLTLFQKHLHISRLFAKNSVIVSLLIIPVIGLYLLLNTDHNNDNIRQLQSIPPSLAEEEQSIKELVAAPATNQFFVVKAETPSLLLDKLEAITPLLTSLVSAEVIDSYNHIGQFVPSRKRQQQIHKLIQSNLLSADLEPLKSMGLIGPEEIAALQRQLKQQEPLSVDHWLQSPLGQRFSYLWLGSINESTAAIITLNNISDLQALEKAAESDSHFFFINKVDKVSALFADYRELSIQMLSLALLVIFLLLTLKYKLLIASYVLLGPVIAASLSIIVNIVVNGSFNLFSTLALFLVFGIGIDYGLFYAEAKKRSSYINLAIGLSAMTTFLSFGLLSFSSTPAIHAFGLTMLTGILTVFILSPILGHKIYLRKGLDYD